MSLLCCFYAHLLDRRASTKSNAQAGVDSPAVGPATWRLARKGPRLATTFAPDLLTPEQVARRNCFRATSKIRAGPEDRGRSGLPLLNDIGCYGTSRSRASLPRGTPVATLLDSSRW
jgi:hypothetical protein